MKPIVTVLGIVALVWVVTADSPAAQQPSGGVAAPQGHAGAEKAASNPARVFPPGGSRDPAHQRRWSYGNPPYYGRPWSYGNAPYYRRPWAYGRQPYYRRPPVQYYRYYVVPQPYLYRPYYGYPMPYGYGPYYPLYGF